MIQVAVPAPWKCLSLYSPLMQVMFVPLTGVSGLIIYVFSQLLSWGDVEKGKSEFGGNAGCSKAGIC